MFYKLNDYEYTMLKDIEQITNVDYEVGDLVKAENILSALEDLKREYDSLLEEYNDWQEKYEDKGWVEHTEYQTDVLHDLKMLGEL